MDGVSLRAWSTSSESFSPSGARLFRLVINSVVFTDSSCEERVGGMCVCVCERESE